MSTKSITRRLAEERRRQGLGPKIVDVAVIEKVGRMLNRRVRGGNA